MGRDPLPKNMKLLKGTHRKHRDQEPDLQPEFTKGVPKPPPELSPRARNEWRRIARELAAAGTLDLAARSTMVGYCISYNDVLAYEEEIEEYGVLVPTGMGGKKANPMISAKNQALQKMLAYAAELGISPAARSKIKIPKKEEKPRNPFAEL